MADSHSPTGNSVDCFASSAFGHTALRCAGLSEAQMRLLMFPVTLFLIGALIAIGNWGRLALQQRIFNVRQFILLTLYGLLVFALGIADKVHPAGGRPLNSSRALGGVAIVPDILLVLTIYHFLPPHVALPWWLDRGLAAASCSGLVLMLLDGIREYSPDGLDTNEREHVYAAGACALLFLVGSLFASQCARYFAILGDQGKYRTFVNLDMASNTLFVTVLIALVAQTCFSFTQPPSYSRILSSSLVGAASYLLLVGASVVQHVNVSHGVVDQPVEEHVPESGREDTSNTHEQEGEKRPQNRSCGPAADGFGAENELTADLCAAQRYLQSGEGRGDEDTRTLRPGEHRICMPSIEPAPGNDAGSGVWHGLCENTTRVQSGVSAASWARLEQMMRARKPSGAGRKSHMAGRPQSGMTYYGSESSFPDGISPGTMRTSVLSTTGAGWRASLLGNGNVPPVPEIDPKYLRPACAQHSHLSFAKPLTPGEVPIPLEAPDPVIAIDHSRQAALASITNLLWRKTKGAGPALNSNQPQKARELENQKNNVMLSSPPAPAERRKVSEPSGYFASSSHASIQEMTSHDTVKSSLPPQYQSSKLWPLPMTVVGKEDDDPLHDYESVPVRGSLSSKTADCRSQDANNFPIASQYCTSSSSNSSSSAVKSMPDWLRQHVESSNTETSHFAALQRAHLKSGTVSDRDSETGSFTDASDRRQAALRSSGEAGGGTGDDLARTVDAETIRAVHVCANSAEGSGDTSPRAGLVIKETQRLSNPSKTRGQQRPDGNGGFSLAQQRSAPPAFFEASADSKRQHHSAKTSKHAYALDTSKKKAATNAAREAEPKAKAKEKVPLGEHGGRSRRAQATPLVSPAQPLY